MPVSRRHDLPPLLLLRWLIAGAVIAVPWWCGLVWIVRAVAGAL